MQQDAGKVCSLVCGELMAAKLRPTAPLSYIGVSCNSDLLPALSWPPHCSVLPLQWMGMASLLCDSAGWWPLAMLYSNLSQVGGQCHSLGIANRVHICATCLPAHTSRALL